MRGLCFPRLCDLDWARTLSGPGREHCGGSLGRFGVPALQARARAAFYSTNPAWLGNPHPPPTALRPSANACPYCPSVSSSVEWRYGRCSACGAALSRGEKERRGLRAGCGLSNGNSPFCGSGRGSSPDPPCPHVFTFLNGLFSSWVPTCPQPPSPDQPDSKHKH